MRKRLITIALAAFVLLAQSASYAWNGTAHRATAFIAYQKLKQDDPGTLKRVLAVLKNHPAVDTDLWNNGGINGDDKDLNLFLNASTFPDDVRHPPADTRFHDESFEKYHHRDDHFVDFPYQPPMEKPADKPRSGTILSSYAANVKLVKNDEAEADDRAVALSWIFHQIGDIHQPLHATSRFSDRFPEGDRGGNSVKLALGHHSARELHAFWDDLLGTDQAVDSPDEIADVSQAVMNAFPSTNFKARELAISDDLTPCALESFDLAVKMVYLPLGNLVDEDGPIRRLPRGYEDDAREVAKQRVAQAGYRIAAELQALFAAP